MKLGREYLEKALGGDYALIGEAGEVWLWVHHLGERIAWLNIADGRLEAWLTIKWREKPEGWKPYEQELGGEELLDAELRPLFEGRGFKVEREGISSCWYPPSTPLASYPAAEVPMSTRVKGIQEAVAAIQFITTENSDVYVDA
jgi:hypothetical protein